MGELDAAAAHVRMIGRNQDNVRGRLDLSARFRLRLSVNADLAGQNQGACPLARRREPSFDDELIQANSQILQP